MRAGEIFRGISRRAAAIGSALLPFVLILFLFPEPAQSEVEDYLPSAPARAVAIKLVKAQKLLHGGKSADLNRALAVGGHPFTTASSRAFIQVETRLHLLHFSLLTNRLVRSPPRRSV